MNPFRFKDSRVLSNALDLKNNDNESFVEILKQLQSGRVNYAKSVYGENMA